jgi:hypothetical protein
MFCIEHWNEIVIPEFGRMSVSLHVMFIFCGPFKMHVPGIPFSYVGRYGIYSPVKVNAQFGILKPFRFFVVPGQRFP